MNVNIERVNKDDFKADLNAPREVLHTLLL